MPATHSVTQRSAPQRFVVDSLSRWTPSLTRLVHQYHTRTEPNRTVLRVATSHFVVVTRHDSHCVDLAAADRHHRKIYSIPILLPFVCVSESISERTPWHIDGDHEEDATSTQSPNRIIDDDCECTRMRIEPTSVSTANRSIGSARIPLRACFVSVHPPMSGRVNGAIIPAAAREYATCLTYRCVKKCEGGWDQRSEERDERDSFTALNSQQVTRSTSKRDNRRTK